MTLYIKPLILPDVLCGCQSWPLSLRQCSTPLPPEGCVFKIPRNGKTSMGEFKTSWENGVKGAKNTRNMILNMYN
jgi:hypothetical protein